MDPQMTPIIPLEQAIITLAGHEFLVVRLPDGRFAVVFRHLCEALDLNQRGQVQRVQRNPMLSQHFLLVLIKTSSGPQVANALSVSVLSLWLGGFNITRISEKKRALIMRLQQDAEAAFTSPFHTSNAQARPRPKPSVPPKTGPESAPPPPSSAPQGEAASVYDLLRAVISRMEQEHWERDARQARMDRQQAEEIAWRAEIQRHVRLLAEEVAGLRAEIRKSSPAPDGPLTDEQEELLYILLYCAERITGQPVEVLKQEVLAVAGAAEVRLIQQATWGQVIVWFLQRLG